MWAVLLGTHTKNTLCMVNTPIHYHLVSKSLVEGLIDCCYTNKIRL